MASERRSTLVSTALYCLAVYVLLPTWAACIALSWLRTDCRASTPRLQHTLPFPAQVETPDLEPKLGCPRHESDWEERCTSRYPPARPPAPLLLCCSVRPQIASALEESGV